MPIKVNLHPWLSEAVGGREAINVTGSTIGECLDEIDVRFPGIKRQLLNKEGEVKAYVLILLNGENYPDGLSKTVRNGDEISIIFLIDGG